ncbi:MAG: SBBP repeat-containing protein, partial [Bryobacterales bacterium]|nr:SBBP repeat-containing protein [Bryobacterales bacterium]
MPDGRYLAQAPDLNAEFFAGAYVRFTSRGADYALQLEGARETAVPVGLAPSPTRISFLQGDEPADWRAGLPTFGAVRYEAVYPGIDMVYGSTGRLKSEFLVAPGADPSRIRMRFSGGTLALSRQGSLIVRTAGGELRDEHLEVFQMRAGQRVAVPARFRLLRGDVAGFELGVYDASLPLTIDPVISYSSYQGGTRIDQLTSVAVDAAGAAYVAGWTDSTNFPTLAAFRGFSGSVEAFVAKISPSGSPVWVTYLGGSGEDRALGIDVDPWGNVYVVGFTTSSNFPKVTPLQANKNLGRDAFVAKINPSGTGLVFSTYWGGSGVDSANALVVDIYGQAYVAGETDSSDFPTVFPWQSAIGGARDA